MNRTNIFRIASSLAGAEDKFTASLHYLIDCHPSIGQRMADLIADRSGLSRSGFVAAEDHPEGNDESKPDFKLVCRDYDLLCEHKIDSDLGDRQLERYLSLIEEQRTGGRQKPVHLVLITNRHHVVSEDVLGSQWFLRPRDSKAPYFLWESLYALLEGESGRLVQEFVEYMSHLEMAPRNLPQGWKGLFEDPSISIAFADRMRLVREAFEARGATCIHDPRGLGLQVRRPNGWVHLLYIHASDRLTPHDEKLHAPYLSALVYVRKADRNGMSLAESPRREISSAAGLIVAVGLNERASWDADLRLVYRCSAELGSYLGDDVALTRAHLLDFAEAAWAHVQQMAQ